MTPFYSASLVETVQSEIASECPGILDVFRDGAIRLLDVCNKGRLLPIYALVPPTIVYEVSKYLFTLIVRGVSSRIMHVRHKHSQEARVCIQLIFFLNMFLSNTYLQKRYFISGRIQ